MAEREPQLDLISEVKKLIANSREEIAQQSIDSGSTWLSCFGSRLSAIEGELQTIQDRFPHEQYEQTQRRIADLRRDIVALTDRGTPLMDEEKDELLDRLEQILS